MSGVAIDEHWNCYGRLVVVGRARSTSPKGALWRCVCKCGNRKDVLGYTLRAGLVRSCGCLAKGGRR